MNADMLLFFLSEYNSWSEIICRIWIYFSTTRAFKAVL